MDRVLSEECPAVRTLDVSVLHSLILERLRYRQGKYGKPEKPFLHPLLRQAITAVRNGTAQGAFSSTPHGSARSGMSQLPAENAAKIHLFLSKADHRTRHEPNGSKSVKPH